MQVFLLRKNFWELYRYSYSDKTSVNCAGILTPKELLGTVQVFLLRTSGNCADILTQIELLGIVQVFLLRKNFWELCRYSFTRIELLGIVHVF